MRDKNANPYICDGPKAARFLLRPPNMKSSLVIADRILYAFFGVTATLLFFAISSLIRPAPTPIPLSSPLAGNLHASSGDTSVNRVHDNDRCDCSPNATFSGDVNAHQNPSAATTFYDDPDVSYTVDRTIDDWDAKRREWLRLHPSLASPNRVIMVTGSQPGPCSNTLGDHLLLRFYKNKADYCRLHGYDLFYNTALLNPSMPGYWAKIPLVRSAMVAHPESEWVWWVDSDAAFTDMEFTPPFDRYERHQLVVPGWPYMVHVEKNWVGLNAGVFLVRNSQWGLDFLDAWAQMGPQTPNYGKWGRALDSELQGKITTGSDDQAALVHLLVRNKGKWGDKVLLEHSYDLHGYWVPIVKTFESLRKEYAEMEKKESALRRRHAEKEAGKYGEMREQYIDRTGEAEKKRGRRRSFVTHFTGCQPCGAGINPEYTWYGCVEAMQSALNFADDQVLRLYGFERTSPNDSFVIRALPFDYPASN